MTQALLERAVARATGESLQTIKRLGFSVLNVNQVDLDPETAVPNVVDWDALQEQRVVLFPVRQERAAA